MNTLDLIRSSISVLQPQYARNDIEVVIGSDENVRTMYFACVFVKHADLATAGTSTSLLEKGPHSMAPEKALDLLLTKLIADVGALVTQQVPKMPLMRWRSRLKFYPTTDNTLESTMAMVQPPPYENS